MNPPACIVGAGAVGLTLSVLLSQRQEVYLLIKEEQRAHFLSQQLSITGARSLSASNTLTTICPFELDQLPEHCDFWICTRAGDVRTSVQEIQHRLIDDTALVLASNGMGIFMDVVVDIGRRIPCVRLLNSFGANSIAPTTARLAGELVASLSSMAEHAGTRDRIAELLTQIGFSVHIEANVARAEWKKTITNAIVNTICSVADVENGALLENITLQDAARSMFNELCLVAREDGFEFPELNFENFCASLRPHASNINSTLAALRNGKKTETEYTLGRVLKLAERYALATPVCLAYHSRLESLEGAAS